MPTYSHSGSLGDIIYSLPLVKHFGAGDFYVKLHATEKVVRKYGDTYPILPFYQSQISKESFLRLQPLLDAQPYINAAHATEDFDFNPTVDLDSFRAVMWKSFYGNYLAGYYRTFGIPYTENDLAKPWLTAPVEKVAKYVVARTARYNGNRPSTYWSWLNMIQQYNLQNEGVFVGLPEEHAAFEAMFNVKIPYRACNDFLGLASVINGCDTFFGNQTFTYSLAQGLGKDTVLEAKPNIPLEYNECFFARKGCNYF